MKIGESVAVVTGSSERLGGLIATTLASLGAKVVIHYHKDVDSAKITADSIEESLLVQADLTTMRGIEHLVTQTLTHFGRWDILINSASIFHSVPLEKTDEEVWDQDHFLHVKAPFFLSKALYLHRKEQSYDTPASIINITDTQVRKITTTRPSYTLSKSALEDQVVVLAKSLAPLVRVNGVAPGAIIPASKEDELYFEKLKERLPLHRLATAEQIIEALLLLIHNDGITGETLVVDGGEHLL